MGDLLNPQLWVRGRRVPSRTASAPSRRNSSGNCPASSSSGAARSSRRISTGRPPTAPTISALSPQVPALQCVDRSGTPTIKRPGPTGGPYEGATCGSRDVSLDCGRCWLAPTAVVERNSPPPDNSPPPLRSPHHHRNPRSLPPNRNQPPSNEAVVVTASKVEQQLVNAPATVSVVTADVIQSYAGDQLRRAAAFGAGREHHADLGARLQHHDARRHLDARDLAAGAARRPQPLSRFLRLRRLGPRCR